MKCQFCGTELPNDAVFCYKCKQQIKCTSCGKMLIKDATICVYCGYEVNSQNNNKNTNHVIYRNDGKNITFDATFSDATAGSISEVFGHYIKPQYSCNKKELEQNIAVVPEIISDSIPIKQNQIDENEILNRIFKIDDDNISLQDTRLKSKSAVDQAARLAFLYLYLNKTLAKDTVQVKDFNAFLKKVHLYTPSFRTWLARHKSYYSKDGSTIRIIQEGIEYAQKIISDIRNENVPQGWTPNKLTSRISKKDKQHTHTQASSRTSTPIFEKDLDLYPKNKESLKEFMKKYKFNENEKKKLNLLFVYYLSIIIERKSVHYNCLNNCYREMDIPYPNDIYQCVADSISKTKWIKDINNLTVTTSGRNEVEHNLLVK
jgi:Fe-S cluster biosynthesis and repair protein YggX